MFDHRHQVSYRIRSSMCRLSGLDHERAACGLRRLDTGIYMQPRCRMLLFQTLSLLRTAHMVGATPTCEINGYCSLEKLAPFVGDLYPSGGLHRALQLRSYKHEVILMVSDIHRLDSFLQAADSLQQLGLSNILLLSYSQDMCKTVAPVVPHIGCGWSSHKHPADLQGNFYVWSLRSIRLGYNVLMMDSDVVVMDNPYKYFKHPPFKDITVLNQAESPVDPNGGLLYVQNAAPDGPAAFCSQIVSRPYRWARDGWKHAAQWGLSERCLYADQDSYADVLPDMASGYLLFPKAWFCLREATRKEEYWQQVRATMERHEQRVWRDEELLVPDSWQVLTNGTTTDLRSLKLRMPNSRGWPEELGGEWYPTGRGPYSTDFLQQLANDAPDLQLWPDHENSSNAAAADRVPTEQFAFMPHWLGIGYWVRGRRGFWDPHMTGNIAQQVIAHTHYIDTHANTAMAKRVVPMSLHRYNWDIPRQANGNQPYFACQRLGADCSKLKVLAFTPSVEKLLASSASWHEFAFLLQGLAALATALGRAVAWPSLPCNTSWLSRGRSVEHAPLELGGMWLPWTTAEGDLICTPWPYVNRGCLLSGRGILPWEYNHIQSQQPPDSHLYSSTIHAVHDKPAEGVIDEGHFALARRVVEINATTEVEMLQPLQHRPILQLNNLVHVVFSQDALQQQQAYNRFWQECIVLDTAAYTAIFDHDGNRVQRVPNPLTTKPMADLGLSHRPARLRTGRLHRRDHGLITT